VNSDDSEKFPVIKIFLSLFAGFGEFVKLGLQDPVILTSKRMARPWLKKNQFR
jgi:hypothetical protein